MSTRLAGGDTWVKNGAGQMPFLANGDKLEIRGDGAYDLRADGPIVIKNDRDRTTITYPNGDCVSFSNSGIESMTREGQKTLIVAGQSLDNQCSGDEHEHVQCHDVPNCKDEHRQKDKYAKGILNMNAPAKGGPQDSDWIELWAEFTNTRPDNFTE